MSYDWDTTGDYEFEINNTLQASITAAGFTLSSGTTVTNFNTAVDLGGVGAVNAAIPTQLAVKTYVDNSVSSAAYWDRSGIILSPHTAGDILNVGNGSVSAPAYSFSADTDSGIFADISNNKLFAIAVAGTQTLAISSSQGWDIDAGVFDLDASGSITLDATDSSNFTVSGSGAKILAFSCTSSDTTGDITFVALDDISIRADGDFSIFQDGVGDANRRFRADSAGAVSITPLSDEDLTLKTQGSNGDVIVQAAGGGEVLIGSDTSTGDIDIGTGALARTVAIGSQTGTTAVGIKAGSIGVIIDTAPFDLNATGAITLDTVLSSNFTVSGTSGTTNLTLAATNASGNASVFISGNDEIELNSAFIDVNSSGAVTIDAAGVSTFTVAASTLTLSTTTSGAIAINAADDASITGDSGNIGTYYGGIIAGIKGAWTTVDLNTTDIVLLGGKSDNAGSGGATVEFQAVSATGASNVNLRSDQYGSLVYGEGGAGTGTYLIKLNATTLATFGATGDVEISAIGDAKISGKSGDIGTYYGDITGAIQGAWTTIDLDTTDIVLLGGKSDNAGSGGATVEFQAVSATGASNVNLRSDQYGSLVYGEGGAGVGTYTIKLDATTLATFSANGTISLAAADDRSVNLDVTGIGDINLTTNGGLGEVANIILTAQGDQADILVSADKSIRFDYDLLEGSGTFDIYTKISAVEHQMLTMDSGVAWTPAAGNDYKVTTTGATGDILFDASGGKIELLNSTGDIDLKTTFTGDVHVIVGNNQRLAISDLGHWDLDGNTFDLDMTGTVALAMAGDLTVIASKAVDITYNDAAGSDALRIYADNDRVVDFTSAGKLLFQPVDIFEVDSSTNSTTGYSLIDGVYYVNGANTTAFAALLQSLTHDAHIVLGPGTHDISWTTAQTLSYDYTIRGSSSAATEIRFTSSDADCCLNFTGQVDINGVKFSRSTAMTNQRYAVQLQASNSTIRDCVFAVDPFSATSGGTTIKIVTGAVNCLLDNLQFMTVYARTRLIESSGAHTKIANCDSQGLSCTLGSVYLATDAEFSTLSDCYFESSDAATAEPTLNIASQFCKIVNTSIIAGSDSEASGHGTRCLTLSGGTNNFSNCYFRTRWPTSGANCTETLVYITGVNNTFSSCTFYQRLLHYSNTGNPTLGMIHINASSNKLVGCHIDGRYCKAAILITGSGDYTTINGCYVGRPRAHDGSVYTRSACIWAQSGSSYGTITSNFFYAYGNNQGWTIGSNTTTGCTVWTIVGNNLRMSAASYPIMSSYFDNSVILGNVSDVGLQGATYGLNTSVQFGTSNTTETSGANR